MQAPRMVIFALLLGLGLVAADVRNLAVGRRRA